MKRNLVILFSISLMLSQAALAGVPDGLVAYWPFDEGEGTTAFDASGNGNDATVEGGADWIEGQLGSALQFNGSNGYVRAPYIPFDSRSHTVAMWVNTPRTGGDQMVIFGQVENQSNNLSLHYRVYNNGTVRMGFYSNDIDASAAIEADTWTHIAFVFGIEDTTQRIYINGAQVVERTTTPYLGTQGDTRIGQWNNSQWFNGMIDDVQVYHSALTEAEVLSIMDGLGDPGAAGSPNPEDEETDVSRDEIFGWKAGEFANTHNAYLGTSFTDVNDATTATPMGVLAGEGLTDPSLDPGRLDFNQTYYWRVDEVNGAPDFTVIGGEIWSFTTEPLAYPVTGITATASSSFGASGPEKTIDGSGLADDLHGASASDMWISGGVPATIEYAFDRAYRLHELWIWNSNQLIEAFVGFGAKDVVIEHSLDGENWTVLDGVGPLAQAPGLAGYAANNTIDFGGAVAQHVRISINSVQGIAPQASLSEVRFLYTPTLATRPSPDSGATNVAPSTSLAWGRNGREADHHDVYVGTEAGNLSLADGVSGSSLDTLALDLQLGQSYSWRVDEVNEAMDPSTWEGTVWNFTTADTIPIDDMEAYADEEFLEIWATWVDGFDDPANGSLVGNGAAGSPETGIVQGGSQSLPMDYGIGAAAQSEATRTFDASMDWTRHGVQGLVLYFQGSSDNTGGALYVKINDAKVAYDGDPAGLMSFGWNKWYIPLSAVTGTDLSRVASLTIGVDNGGSGVVYIDSIVLTGAARDLVNPADPGTAGLLAHYPLDGDYQDASGNGLNGAAVGSPVFENDPARGQVMRLNGLDSAVDLGASDVFNFPGSFSLSVWANITEFNSNWGHALLGNRGESGVGWQLRRHSGNPNLTFTTRGTDGADDPQGNIDVSTAFGQWVHVAAVYDMEAGQRTVYVNGSVDVSIADGGPVAAATHNVYIGARAVGANSGPEAFFSGSLDEVRIYGRALSHAEAASLAGRTQPFDRP